MSRKDQAIITEYNPAREESLIHDTWARSFQRADGVKLIEPSLFYKWHRKFRNEILKRSTCLVLRDKDAEDYVYGYIISEIFNPETLIVHWCYVRSRDRKNKYGYKLLEAALALAPDAKNLVCTHKTYFRGKAEELGFTFKNFRECNYEIE